MIRAALLAAAIAVPLAATARDAAVTPATSERRTFPQGTIDEAEFEGTIVAWTVDSGRDGVDLLVIVEPHGPEPEDETAETATDARHLPPCDEPGAAAPRVLYRWRPGSGRPPEVVRADLAPGARRVLVLDLGGARRTVVDGDDGRVLVGPGADGDQRLFEGSGALALDGGWAVVGGRGGLRAFVPGDDGVYRETGSARLPVAAEVGRWWTTVRTVPVASLGTSASGERLLVTPAEAVGNRRVRVGLVRVGPDGGVSVETCWARLPEAEDVLESRVVLFDGSPLLVTTTKPAGKLGLFDEKRLRVHPLRGDRSRMGIEPLLAVTSRMNLWQEPSVVATDVDGDGRADLALAYWKGLKDSRVVIDVHRRTADGGFESKARTTAFDVPDGDRTWVRYGADVDGDRRADLVVRSGDRVRVHRGVESPKGVRVVARDAIEIPVQGGAAGEVVVGLAIGTGSQAGIRTWGRETGPSVVALDDGATAMLVSSERSKGRERLQVVRLVPEAD